ncbi:MAG: hypothetical protein ABSA81_01855 [Candidatus Bathyarchaeia archaeon]|jgi:hypothetical protein
MTSSFEVALERLKNIQQSQRINERMDEIVQDLDEAGLPHSKLKLRDWRSATFEPPGKPLLFTRIRGSPDSLETDAMYLATYAQVRTSIEEYSLDDDLKSAVAAVAADEVVPESRVEDSGLFLKEVHALHRKEIEKIRQKVVHEDLSIATVLRFVARANPQLTVTQGNRAFLYALEDYERIAERAVQKSEFLEVLKSWGKLDIESLEGMYSKLMALVLRYPGRSATEYHQRRLGFTEVDRASAATWEELNSLVDLGYLKLDAKRRYWPNSAFIKKRHGIRPPRMATLEDWTH